MKRRNFIGLAGSVAAWPFVARAQRSSVPVVGFLGATSPEGYATFVSGFQRGLKETGFVDGDNVATIYRWAEGQYDRLPGLAADLVSRRVSVIIATGGLPSSLAANRQPRRSRLFSPWGAIRSSSVWFRALIGRMATSRA
jgi:putative ABC transport system substrate-binding protein